MSIVCRPAGKLHPGTRFTRWTVLAGADPTPSSKGPRPRVLCRCDCGTERIILVQNLRNGTSQSCGCLQRELGSLRGRSRNRVRSGDCYGDWTVIEEPRMVSKGKRLRAVCACRCLCGILQSVLTQNLSNGRSTGCGCRREEENTKRHTLHGESGTRLHSVWISMKQRCENPKGPGFHNYGGRGIRVCPEWHAYEPFRDWAMEHGYADGLTIERKDVNRGYEPENCTFIPLAEQGWNRRNNVLITAFGETKCLSLWALDRRARACRATIDQRLRLGISPETAISEPPSCRTRGPNGRYL